MLVATNTRSAYLEVNYRSDAIFVGTVYLMKYTYNRKISSAFIIHATLLHNIRLFFLLHIDIDLTQQRTFFSGFKIIINERERKNYAVVQNKGRIR